MAIPRCCCAPPVVVEGLAAQCDEFIDWLRTRTGNWKALALRGEGDWPLLMPLDGNSGERYDAARDSQTADSEEVRIPMTHAAGLAAVTRAVDAQRRLAFPFEELAENDMGTLAETCKRAGVGDDFLEYIMQHRAGAGGVSAAES